MKVFRDTKKTKLQLKIIETEEGEEKVLRCFEFGEVMTEKRRDRSET